jgi:hypothetical protein
VDSRTVALEMLTTLRERERLTTKSDKARSRLVAATLFCMPLSTILEWLTREDVPEECLVETMQTRARWRQCKEAARHPDRSHCRSRRWSAIAMAVLPGAPLGRRP